MHKRKISRFLRHEQLISKLINRMLDLFIYFTKKKENGQYLIFVHRNLLAYARERVELWQLEKIAILEMEKGRMHFVC